MASLMDNFMDVLNQEEEHYRKLAALSHEKTDVLIRADIDRLQEITEAEQLETDVLHNLDLQRESILKDMSVVLRKSKEELTIEKMIELLEKQPDEQQRLIDLRVRLRSTMDDMIKANEQNKMLLKTAMEMVEFDMTLFRSLRQAPETANYDRHAVNTGDLLGSSGFDAKQ